MPVASLYRRTALLAAGGWQLDIGGYEDWDLWLAFAERGFTGVYVPRIVGHYRVRSTRMLATAKQRHARLYAELHKRHAGLFDCRRRLWLASRAPWRLKLAFPVLDRLPLSPLNRHRLANTLAHPQRPLAVRLQRLTRV